MRDEFESAIVLVRSEKIGKSERIEDAAMSQFSSLKIWPEIFCLRLQTSGGKQNVKGMAELIMGSRELRYTAQVDHQLSLLVLLSDEGPMVTKLPDSKSALCTREETIGPTKHVLNLNLSWLTSS